MKKPCCSDSVGTPAQSRREMLRNSATLLGGMLVTGIANRPLFASSDLLPKPEAAPSAAAASRAAPGGSGVTVFPPLFGRSTWDKQGRWAASWIACPDADAPPVVTAFRLRFDSPGVQVRIRVSADERYELYLDGQYVGRGSERGNLEHWFYETYDLGLSAGAHVLVARVWSLGPFAPLAQFSVRPEFVVAAEGDHARRLDTGVAPWEAMPLTGYSFEAPVYTWGLAAPLTIKGADFPWGFERGQGDGWRRAKIGSPAWSGMMDYGIAPDRLLQSGTLPAQLSLARTSGTVRFVAAVATLDTAPIDLRARDNLRDETEPWQRWVRGQAPLSIPPQTRRRVIVDLDDYVCAYPEIAVSGGAGALVRILWAESLRDKPEKYEFAKGNRDAIEGKYFFGMGATFYPDGAPARRFGTLWWAAGRYLEITVQTAAEPMVLERLVLNETRYPLEMESTFTSSDPELDADTQILVRGMQMCAHETYIDCPYFEQMQYVGDARIEALSQYVMSRDDRLSRKALYMIDASRHALGLTEARYPVREPQFIPWFSLLWVGMVHDYARWRDDAGFVRSLLPGVRGVLDAFLATRDSQGRVHTPDGWNDTEQTKEGGLSGSVHWLLVWTLRLAAELEEGFGDPELALRARRHRADLARIADAMFWSEARGLYADDPDRSQFDELVQSLAILSGGVPADRQPILERQLMRGSQAQWTSIHGHFYLLEACRVRGLTPLFFERIRLWTEQRRQGLKTPIESWQPSADPSQRFAHSRSDCHAWGSFPLQHHFTTILGIQPDTWGFRRVEVRPRLGPLAHAAGRLVHPAGGDIVVEVRQDASGLHGRVELPAGVAGTLILPDRAQALGAGESVF